MPLHKIAIAIPEKLLSAVDRAAQSRGESRNRFVIRVLKEVVGARRDADVTGRLNEFSPTAALPRSNLWVPASWIWLEPIGATNAGDPQMRYAFLLRRL